MKVLKFPGMAIASFAVFTLIARLLPGIGQVVALILIGGAASPFFLSGSEDEPNPHGGLGALVLMVVIAIGALALGGLQ